MLYLNYTAVLAEVGWAAIITIHILRPYHLTFPLANLCWIFTMSAVYAVFALTHPWGLLVALLGWPFWLLFRPRRGA